MPIGKDSIQKRVAKNTPAEPTPVVAEPVVDTEPKKPTTQKKPATKKKATTTTTQKKPTTRKPVEKKPAPVVDTEPTTTVISNISPEVVEAVVGHKEGEAPKHTPIGTKMPSYLL